MLLSSRVRLPHNTGSGSISGTALGCLLTPASDSDRSIRAVGPQIEIGTRVRQIDSSRKLRMVPGWQVRPPRPDRMRTKVRGQPHNTHPRIVTPHSAGHRVHAQRGTGVLCAGHDDN